jgi:hypothetical protein
VGSLSGTLISNSSGKAKLTLLNFTVSEKSVTFPFLKNIPANLDKKVYIDFIITTD